MRGVKSKLTFVHRGAKKHSKCIYRGVHFKSKCAKRGLKKSSAPPPPSTFLNGIALSKTGTRVRFGLTGTRLRNSLLLLPLQLHEYVYIWNDLIMIVGMLHGNRVCQTYPNLNEAKVSEMAGQIDLFFVTRSLAKV